MSAIAEMLLHLGCRVSGSDLRLSAATERLRRLGVRVTGRHDASHVEGADLVVFSSAVRPGNAERDAAVRAGIPQQSRGEMLARLAAPRRSVAVAGSHGKTTTAAMAAAVLVAGGLDPGLIVGGTLRAYESGVRTGQGALLVVEADESDRSFLLLAPEVAVLTNLDAEHLDAYAGMSELEDAFVRFAERTPPAGCIVACADDPGLQRLLPRLRTAAASRGVRMLTCATGDASGATVQARRIRLHAAGSTASVRVAGSRPATVELRLGVAGLHNVRNALAAIAVGVHCDVAPALAARALDGFEGAARRLQHCGTAAGVTVVDDYGHHPTEIAAALDAVRLGEYTRIRVVFQPHRYTRTIRLLERFGEALAVADDVLLTDVYAAGESPIPGATAEALAAAVRRVSDTPVRVVAAINEIPALVAAEARKGDVVLTLGAGSIADLPPRILAALRARAGGAA